MKAVRSVNRPGCFHCTVGARGWRGLSGGTARCDAARGSRPRGPSKCAARRGFGRWCRLYGQGSGTMVWAASPVKGCGETVWAASPCFPVRGPRILLQNRQNHVMWPRFSTLHQVFKAEIWATSLIVVRSGTDFVGRDGCFRCERPTRYIWLLFAIYISDYHSKLEFIKMCGL